MPRFVRKPPPPGAALDAVVTAVFLLEEDV
jgi:hypothetical protein